MKLIWRQPQKDDFRFAKHCTRTGADGEFFKRQLLRAARIECIDRINAADVDRRVAVGDINSGTKLTGQF